MKKSRLTLLLIWVFCVSCSYFEKNKDNSQTIVVDTIVDFNTVDAFPLFPNCQEIASREKQQICFQIEMSQHIYASLIGHTLTAKEVVNDTVLVKIKVNSLGKISLSNIEISERTKQLLPNFDSIIEVSLNSLPTISPAIKRDMPVTTEFILPIVLTE